MTKRIASLALTACLIVGTAALVLAGVLPRSCGSSQNAAISVPEAFADRITVYGEGEFTYTFEPSSLAFDKSTATLYANDTLLVILDPAMGTTERRALEREAGGVIVGNLTRGANIVQIHLSEPAGLEAMQALTEQLAQRDGVLFASPEVPVLSGLTAPEDEESGTGTIAYDANGWDDGGEITEENPSGNNWWAEAIGAYTAWDAGDPLSTVTVGVLDSGVDFEHEELAGISEPLSSYSSSTPDHHGTAVASLIAARDNGSGLRGVAGTSGDFGARLLCADHTHYSNSFSSMGDLLGLLNAFVLSDQMESGGAKVINCSFGISSVSWLQDLSDLVENPFDGADEILDLIMHDDLVELQGTMAQTTADMCLGALVSMLNDEETAACEFLIVQSAGNAMIDEKPTEAWRNGYFTGMSEDRFLDYFPNGACGNVEYEDIEERVLTVGATERPVYGGTERFPLSQLSCYGKEWVDICAPGAHDDIFAAEVDGGYTQFGDTSAAAPIVSGAAALLWSIEPDLAAAEVRELLIASTDHVAERTVDPSSPFGIETYPMLDVGQAVIELTMRDASYRLDVQALDSETEEPVADAEVTFTLANADEDGAGSGSLTLITDSDGIVRLNDDESRLYDLVVVAEGYETNDLYRFRTNAFDGEDTPPSVVYLHPQEDASTSAAFERSIDELSGMYDVVATGTEQYSVQSGWGTQVSAERLEGLLCADVFDYDADGTDELLAIRLDTQGGWEVSGDSGWTPVSIVLEMYEFEHGGAARSATETAVIPGLPDYLPVASFGIFRGELDGVPVLYVDLACDFNDQWFATVGLSYEDGAFTCLGGAAMAERYNSTICCEPTDTQALRTMTELSAQQDIAAIGGWQELSRVTWGDSDPVPGSSSFTGHHASYAGALERIGLIDGGPRSFYADNPLRENIANYTCRVRPAEHLLGTDGSSLTELCGASSVPTSSPNTFELTVYDESSAQDAYR